MLERPGDATHGDYATNVALRLAGVRKQPPRDDRGGARRAGERAAAGRAGRDRRPGLRQPLADAGVVRGGARRRSSRPATELRRRLGRGDGADPGRDGVREPDRADHRRRGAERRLRRLGRAAARFAGHEVEREYYYNDAGAQMERFRASVEALRRGEEPPEDGYHGDYVAELGELPGRSRARDAGADRGDARALPHPLRLLGAPERARAARSPRPAARSTRTRRTGAVWARTSALRRRQGPRARSAPKAARRPTAPPTSPTSPTSSTAVRPRDLRPRRRPPRLRRTGTRRSRGCSATTPSGSRCSSTSSCTSTSGGADDEDVEAARRRRLPRRVPRRRSASTPRAGTSSRAGTTRRSRSTSTSPRRRRTKNPVYYVQYAHARIAGILRNARRRDAASPEPAGLARRGGARARQAAARVPGRRRRGDRAAGAARDPDLRDPRRGRLPPLLPRSTACSAPRQQAFRLALVTRDADRDRALPRPDRRRGSRHDVARRHVGFACAVSTEAPGPEPRARARPRHRGGRDSRVALDRPRRQDAADQAAVDAMRLMLDTVAHARRRRHRRGREGRGADALQRRGGRGRHRPRGRRRGRPARGDAAHRARDSRTRSPSSRSPSAGRCSFPGAALYMDKIAVGPEAADAIDIDATPTENVARVAEAKGRRRRATSPSSSSSATVTTTLIARAARGRRAREPHPRRRRRARRSPPRRPFTGVDLLMGIGGTPEGVISAAAIKCLGGAMQGKLWPRNDDERQTLVDAGLRRRPRADHRRPRLGRRRLRRRHRRHERRASSAACASTGAGVETESIVMRSRSGTCPQDRRLPPFREGQSLMKGDARWPRMSSTRPPARSSPTTRASSPPTRAPGRSRSASTRSAWSRPRRTGARTATCSSRPPSSRSTSSGVILYDETIRQTAADGTPFAKLLADRRAIIPGIKVDTGAQDLAGVAGREGDRGPRRPARAAARSTSNSAPASRSGAR